ncbi:MAG: hypothetical protein IJW32_04195 [Clostridia bacterium]|nr:hypothetical protein [Clostridia bacterium]
MEILEYKSDVPGTLYPFIRRKTKLNPDEVEALYTALVTNEQYINFNPELSAKVIALHEEYLNQMPGVITEKRAVTSAKSRHTRASNALAINPDDEKAKGKQLKASTDLVAHKKTFVKTANDLLDVFNNLNQNLIEIIDAFNKANPDNQFSKADIKPVIRGIVKYDQIEAEAIKPNTNTGLVLYVDPENKLIDNTPNVEKENAIVAEELIIEKGTVTLDENTNQKDSVVDNNDNNIADNSTPNNSTEADNANIEDSGDNANLIIADEKGTNPEPTEENSAQALDQQPKQDAQSQEKPKEAQQKKAEIPSTESPKKEEKKEESKKPNVKEAAFFTGSISFLIAVISVALLIAGVGVAGWFLPTLAVASTLTSAFANTAATFSYTEKEPKKEKIKKTKAEKQAEKNAKKETLREQKKEKTETKATQKENAREKKIQKKSSKENSKANKTTQKPVIEAFSATEPLDLKANNETNITATEQQGEKTLYAIPEEQKNIIRQAAEELAKTKDTDDYSAALETMNKVITQTTPANLSINDYVDEDKNMAQACIDYSLAYSTYTKTSYDLEQSRLDLDKADKLHSEKPKNKKAAKEFGVASEHKEYQETLVEKLLDRLEESIITINAILNKETAAQNDAKNEPVVKQEEIIKATSKTEVEANSAESVEQIYHKRYKNEIKQLVDKLQKTFKDKENLLNNYTNIIENCDKIIAIVDHIEKPTINQLKVATACKQLKQCETKRNDIVVEYEKESKILDSLKKSGAEKSRIEKQDKVVESIKEQGFECSRNITQFIRELFVTATSSEMKTENILSETTQTGQEK